MKNRNVYRIFTVSGLVLIKMLDTLFKVDKKRKKYEEGIPKTEIDRTIENDVDDFVADEEFGMIDEVGYKNLNVNSYKRKLPRGFRRSSKKTKYAEENNIELADDETFVDGYTKSIKIFK